MSQSLEPLRAALRTAKTRAELSDAFRRLYREMVIVPADQRPRPAVPLAVRLYNTGHARFTALAAEARAVTAPPSAEFGTLLGVLMARTAEVIGLLGAPPAPPPPAPTPPLPAPPSKVVKKAKRPTPKKRKTRGPISARRAA